MGVVIDEEDYIKHYGILRKSGRYPWGTGGETAEQRSRDFLGMVDDLRRQGLTESQIAESFSDKSRGINFTTTDLRATVTIAHNQKRAADIAMAQRLKYDKGYSNVAIAERMGLAGESSVRALLDPGAQARTDKLNDLATALKEEVEKKGFVDVGIGVERYTGSSRTQFDTALSMLKSEDYVVVKVQEDQATTKNKTTYKVLCPPGKTEKERYVELVQDTAKIKQLGIVKNDDDKLVPSDPPFLQFDSKRLAVRYAEEGGTDADGVIYVRPGVKDTTLGGAQYAQVRVAVDGSHYLKGMAVYKDDLPDGVDLMFNTNKSNTGNKLDALKPMKDDPDDPFGAITKPLLDSDGNRKSVMNIVNTEGKWGEWSKNLASQMLSKQQPSLAKQQLDETYKRKKAEFDEINSLTNPAVKRKLLESFADDVDSSAVHLKAAAMPRQATQVIMPLSKIKDTEIYAPNFRDGERVALVRYPHGGTFEIPELTVNNRNPEGINLLGKGAKDAVGIHPRVAERLSGADFDGDTVLVIPNNGGQIKSKPPLEGLKNFNPSRDYAPYDGMRTIDGGKYDAKTGKVDYEGKNPSGKRKQTEMGKVSNLITDMTIKGANDAEIARAVRHSMVVIDAEKHKLNFKQSAIDNGIPQLKEKYQGGADRGATTLISRTTSQVRVPKRKQGYKIDPETGEKIYEYTGESYVNSLGKTIAKTTVSQQGAEAKDANTLSSGTPMEKVYADHANRLKAMGNEARKELVSTKSIPYSPSAKKVYSSEVDRLNAALNVALKNAPQERQAQLLANAIIKQKRDANPDMANDEIKKIKGKALTEARIKVGAKKTLIEISDREWEAIQAGAISNEKLESILKNANLDRVKALATPREGTVMTSTKLARAEQLRDSGRTAREIADILGVPLSTLTSSLE